MPKSKKRKPKKGKKGTRGGPSPRRLGKASTAMPPGLPADPRAMERVTASISSAVAPQRAAQVTRWEAQDLIYDAWETPSAAERVHLARQALEIWPDCADAYVILAEEAAGTLEDAQGLYAAGVSAGERAVGRRAFEEDVGHFWGLLETRPYMRARAGLARCLWLLGEQEEAIGHYREMLQLNPGDNQGIRYVLLACLLTLGRDDEAEGLLEDPEYADDGTAAWAWGRVLLAFRREGDGGRARHLLGEASEVNPHVPAYLLGRKGLPRELPPYIGFGDESEAVAYAVDYLEAWRATPGALDWLRSAARS